MRKTESDAFVLTDAEADALAAEGAAPGLSKGAARMNGMLGRIFGRSHGPTPDEDSIAFLNNFDKHMRELAKTKGIELRDGDEP